MDIRRPSPARWPQRLLFVASAGIFIAGLTWLVLWSRAPKVPVISAETVWLGSVEHGTFVRRIRGPGKLVPTVSRWVSASTPGRVDEIRSSVGESVLRNTIVLRLENPEVAVDSLRAKQTVAEKEFNLWVRRGTLEADVLEQDALVAEIQTRWLEAKYRHEANMELRERGEGLVSAVEFENGRMLVDQLARRVAIAHRRLEVVRENGRKEIGALEGQLRDAHLMVGKQRERLESLNVVAGIRGVLTEVLHEEGQWVPAGERLARVVGSGPLKAVLRIPPARISDVHVGQQVDVEIKRMVLSGVVARIEPTVRDGVVAVGVDILESIPIGARPNESVAGTVVVAEVEDTTYTVGRPVNALPNSVIGVFRVGYNGVAERVDVRIGRVSVGAAEIVDGLEPGDRIVLSDMSEWLDYATVRLD